MPDVAASLPAAEPRRVGKDGPAAPKFGSRFLPVS
jgi:hypothetical protein